MKQSILLFILLACFSFTASAQLTEMPNLIANDIEGNTVNIYDDYLDQGKPVMVHFMASWNPWDEFVFESGAFQEFYSLYGPDGLDVVGLVSYEIDSSTNDIELYGNGNQGEYNYVDNSNWPIINEVEPLWGLDTFGVNAMPSFALICPNGDVTCSSTCNPMFPANILANWTYEEILNLNGLVDFYELNCGIDLPDANIAGYTTFDSDNCDLILDNDMIATKVVFDDGTGSPRVTYSYPGGAYEYTLPDGTYDLTYESISPLFEICEQEAQITINGDTLTDVNAIFDPIIDCPAIYMEVVPWITRPCEVPSYFAAAVCNGGPIPYNGGTYTLQLEPGATIDTIVPMINYNYDSVTGVFTADVDTLEAFDCFYFYFLYENPCSVEAGDTLCFSSFIDLSGIDAACQVYNQGQVDVCIEVTGSYDPNDKTGLTRGETENNYIEAGTELEYLIRFQNTGSDTAFTVRIEDQLSDQFEVTSVRPILASHDYKMSIEEGQIEFLFEDILLVDSFKNEPESHGFVKFAVTLKDDLAPSEEIFNSAAIYFDANDPIITNNFKYTIFPIDFVEEIELKSLAVFPNPANEMIQLSTDMLGDKKVTILNVDGRVTNVTTMFEGDKANVDISRLIPGIYFIQIENEVGEKSEVKRVVKL